jgi:hypothetical protein
MSLRIRRGTETQRTGVTFDSGELVYTTDTKQLWIGDGITTGGTPLVGLNITGYGLTFNASSKKIEVAGLTADDITNGVNNKFFSTDLAQDAAAALFSAGSHTNISFQYDDTLNKINATVTLDGIGLTDVVNDTSPSLGGDLTLNGNDITGTGDINIVGSITSTSVTAGLANITNGVVTGSYFKGQKLVLKDLLGGPEADITIQNISDLLIFGVESSPIAAVWNLDTTNAGILIRGVTTGQAQAQPSINVAAMRGSIANQTILQNNDSIGLIKFSPYTANPTMGGYAQGAFITSVVTDPSIASGDTVVDCSIAIGTFSDNIGTPKFTTFEPGGKFTATTVTARSYFQMPTYADTTARDTAIPTPAAGMLVFLTATSKFQGYNGSIWENLN